MTHSNGHRQRSRGKRCDCFNLLKSHAFIGGGELDKALRVPVTRTQFCTIISGINIGSNILISHHILFVTGSRRIFERSKDVQENTSITLPRSGI